LIHEVCQRTRFESRCVEVFHQARLIAKLLRVEEIAVVSGGPGGVDQDYAGGQAKGPGLLHVLTDVGVVAVIIAAYPGSEAPIGWQHGTAGQGCEAVEDAREFRALDQDNAQFLRGHGDENIFPRAGVQIENGFGGGVYPESVSGGAQVERDRLVGGGALGGAVVLRAVPDDLVGVIEFIEALAQAVIAIGRVLQCKTPVPYPVRVPQSVHTRLRLTAGCAACLRGEIGHRR
jgi:hypothetical protein